MKTFIKSPPYGELASEPGQRASSGRRLKGGRDRKPSGTDFSGGSAALNRRFTFTFPALLAALALCLLFLLPGGPLHAQDAAIPYPENDTGAVATLTAVDPEGESIVWSLENTGDDEYFDIENGVLTFKSSPDFESPQGGDRNNTNTYVVTVKASDGGDDTTAMEELTIEVTNVEEPGTVMLSTLQPQVGVEITATLTDPDNIGADDLSSVSWQWYRGNSEIVGATGGPGAIMSSYTPTTGDVGSVLRATAMYDDGEDDDKTAQEDSAHAVRQAPESNVPPTFPTPVGQGDTNQEREVAENTPAGTNIGAPVTASDTDVLTYSLEDLNNNGDAASFDINRATGQLITKGPLDHEEDGQYIVIVHATDPFGAPVEAQATIMVTDVNEAPSVTGVASIDHPESNDANVIDLGSNQYTVTDADEDDNVDNATDVTWSLSGADASKFEITGTGATRTLAFLANPDYESPGDSGANNVYEVTVVVTDTESNTDEQDVTVKVTNVEEIGEITLSTLQARVGFPVTATLADPDNITADSVSWQWYRGADFSITEPDFAIFNPTTLPANECDATIANNCSIKGATTAAYVPVDADKDYSLTVVATYIDGNANTDDRKDYAAVATGAGNDVLENTINDAPVFPDQDTEMEGRQTAQERMIPENVMAAENIGVPVAATDEDTNLTYSLGGPDAASFDIVRTSGQLQTKAELDKETKDTYTVTVTAADSLSESSTITVTIKVTNVDEMPDLEGEAPEEYAENGTGAVATFTAEDPEGESIVWSLDGADMNEFTIVNGGAALQELPRL